jgi:hypothetical protein
VVFKQKFIVESSVIQISVDVDRKLTNYYDDIKWDIIDLFSHIEYTGEFNIIESLAFVVHTELGDYFFVSDFIFETPNDLIVIGIREIDLDTFLDYIKLKRYIRHGV